MPTYCYRTTDGQLVERVFPIGTAPPYVRVAGRRARRDMTAERGGNRPCDHGYPLRSRSLGCPPHAVEQRKLDLKRVGVATEFDRDGSAIIRNRSHKLALMRACAPNMVELE